MMELDTFSCLFSINIIVFSLRADYTVHICSALEHHVHAFNSKIPKCWHVHVCGRMQYSVYLSVSYAPQICLVFLHCLRFGQFEANIQFVFPIRVMDCEYILDFLRVYAHSSIRYYYLPFDRSPYDTECLRQYKQSCGEFRAHNG